MTPAEAHRLRVAQVEHQTFGDTRHYNVGADIRRVFREVRHLVSFQWCQHHDAENGIGMPVAVDDPSATHFNVRGAIAKVTLGWGNKLYAAELRKLAHKLLKEVIRSQDAAPTTPDEAMEFLNRVTTELNASRLDRCMLKHIKHTQHRFPRTAYESNRLRHAANAAGNLAAHEAKIVRARDEVAAARAARLARDEMQRWKRQEQIKLPLDLQPSGATKQVAYFGRRI